LVFFAIFGGADKGLIRSSRDALTIAAIRRPIQAVEDRMAGSRSAGRVRIGVGGWSYEPWRESFYPPEVSKARELSYAASVLTAIEINATFYRGQSPATFAKWRDATPADFVFSVKASRYATHRSDLREAGPPIARLTEGGLAELGPKLGPVLWQFLPSKRFDRDEIAAFLDMLPQSVGGVRLRHALEPRHASFADPDFVALMRARGAAIVLAGDSAHPQIADPTADFVYARIQGTSEAEPLGYGAAALDLWAERARAMARGETPADLTQVGGAGAARAAARDVFLFVISGFKARNPAAAQALIARLDGDGGASATRADEGGAPVRPPARTPTSGRTKGAARKPPKEVPQADLRHPDSPVARKRRRPRSPESAR
jgi:uncharacterized protein YecE (DUF72 family)